MTDMSTMSVFRGVDGQFLAVQWHYFIVYFYVNRNSNENFQAYVDWIREVRKSFPQGTVNLVWVSEWAAKRPPNSHVRALFSNLVNENPAQNLARAYLIDTDGFAGATIRSVLTGMLVLQRQPLPTKVFRYPLDALQWLGSHHPTKLQTPLQSGVELLRTELSQWITKNGTQ